MKYVIISLIAFSFLIITGKSFSQTAGSSLYEKNDESVSIDQKVIGEMNTIQKYVALTSSQINAVEAMILKNELEKEVEINSGTTGISRVAANIQCEANKENALKEILTLEQYKLYKLNKLN